MRSSALAIALSVLAACVQNRRIELDAEPGDLVVLAAVAPSGAIIEKTRWSPGAEPNLSVGPGESLVAFVLPRAQLIAPDGAPLSQEMLEGLAVGGPERAAGSTLGACGRCLAETAVPPQIVNAGDRCALPAFAEATVVAGQRAPAFDVAALRASIVLEWPGSCACEQYALRPGSTLSAYLVELSEDLHPVQDVGQADNGDVSVAGERHLSITSALGVRRAEKSVDQVPFTGPVLASASSAGGDVYVASHDEDSGDAKAILHLFDDQLSLRTQASLTIRPEVGRWFADRMIFAGSTEHRDDPQAIACLPAGANLGTCGPVAELTCRNITPASLSQIGNGIPDMALVGGRLALGGRKGVLLLERPLDPTAAVTLDDASNRQFGAVSDCAGSVRWRLLPSAFFRIDDMVELRKMAAVGDYLVSCVSGSPSRFAAIKVTPDIFTASVTPMLSEFPFAAGGYGDCGGFSEVPECPGAVRASHSAGSIVLAQDVGGNLVERTDCTSSQVGPSPQMFTLVPGYTLARTYGGQVFARRDLQSAPDFVRVYGADRVELPIAAIVALDGRFIAFRQNGDLELFNADNGSVQGSSLVGLQNNEAVLAATVLDPASSELLVVTWRDGAHFYRLKNAGTDEALEPYELSGAPDLSRRIFRKVASIAPGVFLLITTDGRIYLLRGDRLEEVERNSTEPIPPRITSCPRGHYPTLDDRADILRGVSGALGVGWVSGCEGTLYRVSAFSDPPRADDVTLKGKGLYDEIQDGPPSLFSAAAACPDSALFATSGTGRVDQEQGRLYELAPQLGLRPEPVNVESRAGSLLGSGNPSALAAFTDFAVLGFDSGALRVAGAQDTFRINDPITEVAVHPSGAVVAGTVTGRLIFGTVTRK